MVSLCPVWMPASPRSSEDRVLASEARCVGSNPAGGAITGSQLMHVYARFRAKGWSRRIGAVAVAMAMLALMTAAVACDPEEGQPTDAPPTATAVTPSPSPTQAPTVNPGPAPTIESTPTPTPTPEPSPPPNFTPTPLTPMPTPSPTATPTPVQIATLAPATPTPTPDPNLPPAQEILRAATAAMAAVQSGSVRIDFSVDSPSFELPGRTEFSERRVETFGVYQAPDRSRFTTLTTPAGITIEYETVVIGDTAWLENPLTGLWGISQEVQGILGNGPHLGAMQLDVLDDASSSVAVEGVEELDGVLVYHLRGELYAEVASFFLLGDPMFVTESPWERFEIELWIGIEDSLVRKLSIGDFRDRFRAPTWPMLITRTYWDFDKPVDIQPPDQAGDTPFQVLPTPFEDSSSPTSAPDDFGDGPYTATRMEVGETVEGEIEARDDADVFTFTALENEYYLIDLSVDTLSYFYLTLFDSRGDHSETGAREPGARSSRIEWRRSWTADYYISVSGSGATGSYTLSISTWTPPPDDYGNNRSAATRIATGESIEGRIDYKYDGDFFAFQAEEGKTYLLELNWVGKANLGMTIYDEDSFKASALVSRSSSSSPPRQLTWEATDSGEFYLGVGAVGPTETYTLTLTEVEGAAA